MAVATFSLLDPDVQRLFKINYAAKSDMLWNFSTPVIGLIKQSKDADGLQVERPIPMSISGGIGCGPIPDYNRESVQKAILTTKTMASVTEIERRTLKQGTDKHSYINGLAGQVKQAVMSFTWMDELFTFGDGSGSLGTIDTGGVTPGAGGTYTVVISAATFILANFEPRLLVNVGSGDTSKFEVTSINPSTRAVTLTRDSGSKVPADGDVIYLQNCQNAAPMGFAGVTANTGSIYGITSQYRWQSSRIDAANASITPDMIDQLSTDMEANTRGKTATHIFMHYEQLRRLKALLEHQKVYTLSATDLAKGTKLQGKVSWSGVQFMGASGVIDIIPTRFVHKSKVYAVYMPDLEGCHAPGGPSWVQEDGSVWKHQERPSSGFWAYYQTFKENYFPPPSVGLLYNLQYA